MTQLWECPECHGQTRTTHNGSKRPRRMTTAAGPLVTRWRKCDDCGASFWTVEALAADIRRFAAFVMGKCE
jgi:hypothetical protein